MKFRDYINEDKYLDILKKEYKTNEKVMNGYLKRAEKAEGLAKEKFTQGAERAATRMAKLEDRIELAKKEGHK